MSYLVYIVTSAISVKVLLRGQLEYLQSSLDMEVLVITAPSPILERITEREKTQIYEIPMSREIDLVNDLQSLYSLIKLLKKIDPTLVNASTPKAGFLGMFAAVVARIPVRVYQQRGLRLETTKGIKRIILMLIERLIMFGAHYVVCNSHSLMERCEQLKLAPNHKLQVLGNGSSNGVDIERFTPGVNLSLRQSLGIDDDKYVLGFVGRLTRDKGIEHLWTAFEALNAQNNCFHLLLVGPFEEGDALSADLVKCLHSHPNVTITGFVNETPSYYQVMDVFVFPSLREGFPNALLEAASSGLPTVGFNVTGTKDAIVHDKTGYLAPAGDVNHLVEKIIFLHANHDFAEQMGLAGRQRCVKLFSQHAVWQNWIDFYESVVQ